MRVMVLYRHQRKPSFQSFGGAPFGREVLRVPVDDDCSRHVREYAAIKRKIVPIVVEIGRTLQVTDVLRQYRLAFLQEAEGRLELPSRRQQRRRGRKIRWQLDRARREAARAAQHATFSIHGPHARTIYPGSKY